MIIEKANLDYHRYSAGRYVGLGAISAANGIVRIIVLEFKRSNGEIRYFLLFRPMKEFPTATIFYNTSGFLATPISTCAVDDFISDNMLVLNEVNIMLLKSALDTMGFLMRWKV